MSRPTLPSRRALGLGLAGLAALAGLAWVIATQGPMAPVQITIARAEEQSLAVAIFGIGTVEARRSYAIGPTAAGRVARVLVDQGDVVVPGQLLAEMEPVDLDDRRQASRATFQRASELARSAEAAVTESRSRHRMAQASAERYADLRRKSFVSQEAADTKRHEANAAEAALAAAEAALAAAREEARRAAADQAATDKARGNLRMTSPVAGVVTARLAEPGSTLVAGQAVLQVVDPASLWLKVRVDQGRAGGLAPGLAADVVLRSRPGQPLHGRVERVDLVSDAVTEERIANIVLTEASPRLTIGELAEATIHLPTAERALVIPTAAVKRVGGAEGAWLLADGRTVFRPLTLGARSLDGRVQVIAGLQAGEAVAVHSSRPLVPELRVKVVDALVRSGS